MAEHDTQLALVTGGNGFVGSHLCESLHAAGIKLRLLVRQSSQLNNLEALPFESVCGDLRDTDSLTAAVDEVDYIFHAGGLVRAFSPQEFHQVNGEGTRNLIEVAAAQTKRLKRFVYISSQAAAGPSESREPRTEADQPAPISDYGQSKLSGELAVMKYAAKLPVTIIRPPALFGPRDTDMLQFFQTAAVGWLVKFGGQESFVSLAYVKDVIAGIMAALQNDRAIGETFFINTEDVVSAWQAQKMIAESLKVEIKPLRVPVLALKLIAALDTANARRSGRPPNLTADKVGELTCRYWTSSSQKARELLGYKPQMSLQSAFNETAAWYREHRWL
jgi:nucleoside-diphosphate-sugar epimerase